MGNHDQNDPSAKTVPLPAIDGRTEQLDKYAIMSRVQQDVQNADEDGETLTMQSPIRRAIPVDETGEIDAKATQKMPAVSEYTVRAESPVVRDLVVEEQKQFKTMQIVLEPVDPPVHASQTVDLSTRITFEAVVQADGVIHLPANLFKSGRVRPGMRLKIVADPA